MATGQIKKLVRDRGFGFISTAEGKEIFFHSSGLQGGEFDSLKEGQTLEFEIEQGPKGERAVNIKAS
ncbi:cold-shock protein [Candidatus Omnitrophota bacterium]